jgi:ABC-type proline/glycine betaine transport system permease subunit
MKWQIIFFLSLAVGFGILLHQYVNFGVWWSWSQFLHHENFAAICFAVAFGIWLGIWLVKCSHFSIR